MIIKHWMDCPITTYGRLREWRIFARRKGDAPDAETGEVCFEINTYGRAVVIPGVTTEPAAYPDEVLSACVAGGQGVLRLKGEDHPLRPGHSFAIPPGMQHRFQNTGEGELEFIFSRRPPSSADNKFAISHWSEDRPRDQWGGLYQGHWHHIYRGPSCEVHIADLPPHKFSHPHSHTPVLDEIWYVQRGRGWHWMGQEYRPHYPGHALWLDPSELHSLMNPTEEGVEYIYAASWALVADRARALKEPPLPRTAAGQLAELEADFAALVAAYRQTGVSIFGVDQQLPRIEKLLVALKK
jgi:mannose-6-phosphate isomerase-like protein (cupin superfamily)